MPSPETQLKPVHSNYVPAQVDKHLEFLDFPSSGYLVVGRSSLTTRYWPDQPWYYSRAGHGDKVETATDPTICLTGTKLEETAGDTTELEETPKVFNTAKLDEHGAGLPTTVGAPNRY